MTVNATNAFTRFSARLRVALRLARRDLAAHKVRTVVALLLFALPVSLAVGFLSMVESYDRSVLNSPVEATGQLSFPREAGEHVTTGTVEAQYKDLSAALGDLADSLSPGVLQTSEFSRGDRSADLNVITVASSPDGSGPAVEPGTVFLNEQAAFLMDADDGDTVTVDGTPLTVTLGAGYEGSAVNTDDVPVTDRTMKLTWYMPDDPAVHDEISNLAADPGHPALGDVSLYSPGSTGTMSMDAGGTLAVLSTFVLAVLLISAVITPVFAVAARRQRRAMGLMSATGAAPGDLRRVMLAEGVVVSAAGTALGLVLSTGVAALLNRVTPSAENHWSWAGAAAVSAVALLCGVTSALLPALRAGKEDPVQALADGGSVRMTGFRRRMLLGLVFLVPGVLLVTTAEDELFTLGVSLCGIGVVLSSSLVVWLMSRLGTVLPTPLRLAVRDSLRNHHRTVPAVAAIAGVTFLASAALTLPINTSSATRYDDNVAVLTSFQGGEESFYSDEIEQTAERMNAKSHHTVAGITTTVQDGVNYMVTLDTPPEARDYVYTSEQSDIRVTDGGLFSAFRDADDRDIHRATEALADGKAVVTSPKMLHDGELTLELHEYDAYFGYEPDYTGEEPGPADKTLSVPGVVVPGLEGTGAVDGAAVSPDTATELGLDTTYVGTAFILDSPVTQREAALTTMGVWPVNSQFVSVDTPAVNGERALMSTVPVALSWILTLGTVLLVVVLAATESRRDMATIAAVGAPPGLLRRFSAAQAVFIALPGTLIGVVTGALPKICRTVRELHEQFVFYTGFLTSSQWIALGLTAVVGPVLAWAAGSVIGAVTSRDRTPVRRR